MECYLKFNNDWTSFEYRVCILFFSSLKTCININYQYAKHSMIMMDNESGLISYYNSRKIVD